MRVHSNQCVPNNEYIKYKHYKEFKIVRGGKNAETILKSFYEVMIKISSTKIGSHTFATILKTLQIVKLPKQNKCFICNIS